MSFVLASLMILIATVPVLDAARRRGAFARPEFYLLVSIYLYATFGYLTYKVLPPGAFNFMIPVAGSSVELGYATSVLAMVALYLGGGLHRPMEAKPFDRENNAIFVVAIVGGALALLLNVYYMASFGLFSGGFNRVTFIDEFKRSSEFSAPYMVLWLAALPLLALYERKPLAWVSWSMFGAFALLHLVVGDRRVVLTALIIVVTAKLLRGSRVRKGTLLAGLAAVLLVGVAVGNARAGGVAEVFTTDPERLFRSLSEFARPFVTLLLYVDQGYAMLWGASIAEAFFNLVPQVIVPFTKPLSLGQEFREVVEPLGNFPERVAGFGFFPVTEALLNFGFVGVPVLFFLLGLALRKLSSFALRNAEFAFVIPILCAEAFTFGRSAFSNVLVTSFWASVFAVALCLIAQLAPGVIERGRAAFPGLSHRAGKGAR